MGSGIKQWALAVGATLGAFALAGPARATPLPAGSSVTPDLSAETGTLVASTSGTFAPLFGISPSGIYHEAVFRQSDGTLDFVFQIRMTGGILESMSTAGYAGYQVSASQQNTGTPPPGGFVTAGTLVAPNATRTGTSVDGGDVVRFNYPPTGPVRKNQTTAILIIHTDAKEFVAGALGFQDGGAASAAGFAPRRFGAPEPASLVLLGGLSAGVAGARLRRRLAGGPGSAG